MHSIIPEGDLKMAFDPEKEFDLGTTDENPFTNVPTSFEELAKQRAQANSAIQDGVTIQQQEQGQPQLQQQVVETESALLQMINDEEQAQNAPVEEKVFENNMQSIQSIASGIASTNVQQTEGHNGIMESGGIITSATHTMGATLTTQPSGMSVVNSSTTLPEEDLQKIQELEQAHLALQGNQSGAPSPLLGSGSDTIGLDDFNVGDLDLSTITQEIDVNIDFPFEGVEKVQEAVIQENTEVQQPVQEQQPAQEQPVQTQQTALTREDILRKRRMIMEDAEEEQAIERGEILDEFGNAEVNGSADEDDSSSISTAPKVDSQEIEDETALLLAEMNAVDSQQPADSLPEPSNSIPPEYAHLEHERGVVNEYLQQSPHQPQEQQPVQQQQPEHNFTQQETYNHIPDQQTQEYYHAEQQYQQEQPQQQQVQQQQQAPQIQQGTILQQGKVFGTNTYAQSRFSINVDSYSKGGKVKGEAYLKHISYAESANSKRTVMTIVLQDGIEVNGVMWSLLDGFTDETISQLEGGIYDFDATWGEFNNNKQLTVKAFYNLNGEPNTTFANYLGTSPNGNQFDQLALELYNLIEDTSLQALAYNVLYRDGYLEKYKKAFAAQKVHDAKEGGLFEHTIRVAVNAYNASRLYPTANASVVIVSALLHDLGKTIELDSKGNYTMEGQLFGHIYMGAQIIEGYFNELVTMGYQVSQKTRYNVIHCILAHHGELEWGSPVNPKTIEAEILHECDGIDAGAIAMSDTLKSKTKAEMKTPRRTIFNLNI